MKFGTTSRREKAAEVFATTVEALESREEHKPEDKAVDIEAAMGIELLTEEQYRELQKLGNFLHENVELGENTS